MTELPFAKELRVMFGGGLAEEKTIETERNWTMSPPTAPATMQRVNRLKASDQPGRLREIALSTRSTRATEPATTMATTAAMKVIQPTITNTPIPYRATKR